jgi:hypothetical protein
MKIIMSFAASPRGSSLPVRIFLIIFVMDPFPLVSFSYRRISTSAYLNLLSPSSHYPHLNRRSRSFFTISK